MDVRGRMFLRVQAGLTFVVCSGLMAALVLRRLGSDKVTLEVLKTMRVKSLRSAGALALILQIYLAGLVIWAAPVVGSFLPAMGGPGTQVVINGSGFSTATQMKFDTAIADFNVASDTRMSATVPLDATSGQIRVTNPTGAGVSSGKIG